MTSAELPKLNMPEGWEPPVPSYGSHVVASEEKLVVLYLGAQAADRELAREGFATLLRFLGRGSTGPYQVDRAFHQTTFGAWEFVAVAYFLGPDDFSSWSGASSFSAWWDDPGRVTERVGYWQERLTIPSKRIEALHSSPNKDGHSNGGELVGPIRHHAYWGGMRDRLPVAREDFLRSPLHDHQHRREVASRGARIVVSPPLNMAIIRSGQDRAHASKEENELYDEIVKGRLIEGMDFLARQGEEVGCYSCRYLTEIGPDGVELQRNFGHCLFHSLSDLEQWSKSHPTHLAIYGSFFMLQKRCNNQMTLRFWHEVAVIPGNEQHFEYINCDPQTGLVGYFS